MASEVDTAPLVGRTGTMATLRSALYDDLRPGQTGAVFLTGESGVGKTRLLNEVGEQLREAGALVLTGACLDIGDASPLHPVRQALRRLDAEQDQARTASAIRGLLQVFDEETPGPDGAGALLERVAQGLHLVAGGRPLVLVLDDLQWVDRSTRQLLLYLLAGLGDLQLSVLAAIRAESLRGAHPLRRVLTELRRLRSVRVIDLLPLDRAEFLTATRAALEAGDWLLIGTDLVKDPAVIVPAYDDAAGVTAEFNRNVLRVINRELGADFDPEAFRHVAVWDPEREWIEMRLRAERPATVRVLDTDVVFAAGEELRTEVSAKFRPEGIAAELTAAGFTRQAFWTDPDGLFGVTLARAD